MSSLVKIVTEGDLSKLTEKVILDNFNELLNQEPPKEIIKQHPLEKNVRYIPIDKIEVMLTKFFQDWYVEVISCGQMLNSAYTHVRIHYYHPILNNWRFQDGLGAVAIQTKKDAAPADMTALITGGVMKALPASKSYAVKDAAEHLGKIFGRDLNRKDTIAFSGEYRKSAEEVKKEKRDKLKEELNASN